MYTSIKGTVITQNCVFRMKISQVSTKDKYKYIYPVARNLFSLGHYPLHTYIGMPTIPGIKNTASVCCSGGSTCIVIQLIASL